MTDLLSVSEVKALRDDDLVEITWSGGNGPHRYIVRWYCDEDLWAYTEQHPDIPVSLVISRCHPWDRILHQVRRV